MSTAMLAAARLSDRELLDATARASALERRTTADLLALLAELDSRKLYLGEGCSSLFAYCTQVLHLSEPAAYSRITATRVARRFPTVLARLADGDLTLTSISLLAAHLTDENADALLDAARHASKREVERLVACLCAQPDVPTSVRRLPSVETSPAPDPAPFLSEAPLESSPAHVATRSPRRDTVAPLGVDRYLLRVTIDAHTQAKLDRARDLLRHTIPTGDLAKVLDRALTALIEQLERRKVGHRSRPARTRARVARPRGRHIPAAVRREVWARDSSRCTFIGPHGRCSETGFLEFHHRVPYAHGGASDAANLELRCRAHNAYEAARVFGEARPIDSRSTPDAP
jgi:5-methylcytosine-specific restriction endonuclease McrA